MGNNRGGRGKDVEFGLIGASGRGLFLCWEAMKNPGFRLKAAADPSGNSRQNVRKAFGRDITLYSDAGRMLREHPGISAVFVASNDASHYENVLTALRFRKHIYVEKPLAQHIGHCDTIVNAWKKDKVVFCGGLELRYVILGRKIRELLAGSIIGKPAYMSCVEYVPGGGMHIHPLYRRKKTGRSLLLQKGTHDIDLLNWFSGSRPQWVFGAGGLNFYGGRKKKGLECFRCPERKTCQPGLKETKYVDYLGLTVKQKTLCAYAEDVDMEDNYQIIIGYENNIRASFIISYNAPEYSHEYVLVGDQGKMKGFFDHHRGLFTISYKRNARPEEETIINLSALPGAHGGGDALIIKDFLDCIRSARQPVADILAARDAAAVAAGAQDSIESGKVVAVPKSG